MTLTEQRRPIPGSGVGEMVTQAAAILAAAGVESARLDARLIVLEATGWSREELLTSPGRVPDDTAFEKIEAMLDRRAAREPLSHILGRREFWSLPFRVTRDTLTPRPESESVIEAVLAGTADRTLPLRLLDLGTGTGCLLLALLYEFRVATGIGVDRSAAALTVADSNARALGLAGRARFVLGDWTRGLNGRFDVIVANPPYVRTSDIPQLAPEVARFEPRGALDGGAGGLDAYRRLVPEVATFLADDGIAVLEVGAGQADAVEAFAVSAALRPAGRHRDLAGIDRVVTLRH